MSRRKKIILGIGIDTLGSIIAMAVGLIVLPCFFQYISKEEYGLWLAVNGLVALISIADIGTDQYLTTVISDDKKFYSLEFCHHLLSVLIVKLFVVIIFTIIGTILYLFISGLLIIETSSLDDAKNTFLIAIFYLIFTLFSGAVSTILYGRHHYALVNSLTSLSSIMASFGTIIYLALDYKIRSFPLALLSAALIQFTILSVFLIKYYPNVRFKFADFRFQNKKEMIGYSASFQIQRLVHILRTQYIIIVINNLIGPSAATLYTVTNRLPQMITVFTSKVALPFFPTFSEYFANQKKEIAANVFIKINRLLFRFSLFAAIVCLVVTRSFVSLWVDLGSFAGISILFLMCFYIFITSAMGAFGIVIFSSKKFENWSFISFFEIIIAVTLSYALSFNFGLLGIIAGFVFASLINQFYLFTIVLKQLEISYKNIITNVFFYAISANIATFLFAIIIMLFIEISSWRDLVLVCLTFTLIHVLSYEGVLILNSKEIGFRAKLRSVVKIS